MGGELEGSHLRGLGRDYVEKLHAIHVRRFWVEEGTSGIVSGANLLS